MKYFSQLFLILSISLLVSCGSEDETQEEQDYPRSDQEYPSPQREIPPVGN